MEDRKRTKYQTYIEELAEGEFLVPSDRRDHLIFFPLRDGVYSALESCFSQNCKPISAFRLLELRTGSEGIFSGDFLTPALFARGRTKQGTEVYVIAHPTGNEDFPNPLFCFDAIQKYYSDDTQGNLFLSEKSWQELLDKDSLQDANGNRLVSVISSANIETQNFHLDKSKVLSHPFYQAFAARKDRLEDYCEKVFFTPEDMKPTIYKRSEIDMGLIFPQKIENQALASLISIGTYEGVRIILSGIPRHGNILGVKTKEV